MPESRSEARSRAKKLGFPLYSVTKATEGKNKGGYFIAPHGLTTSKARRAYANMRSDGMNKAKAARIAHSIEDN